MYKWMNACTHSQPVLGCKFHSGSFIEVTWMNEWINEWILAVLLILIDWINEWMNEWLIE